MDWFMETSSQGDGPHPRRATRELPWPPPTETDGVKWNKSRFPFLFIWGSKSVKENDMLLNGLPKEGWPLLTSSRATLKSGPQLSFVLRIWMLIHHLGTYIQDGQVSRSPVNNRTIMPGKTGLATRSCCRFPQYLNSAQSTPSKEVNTLRMLHRLSEMSAACTPVKDNYQLFLTIVSNLLLKNCKLCFPTSNNELTRTKEGIAAGVFRAGGKE